MTYAGYMLGGGGYDPDVVAHLSRMTSLDSQLRSDVSDLIVGLKADSLWSLIEQLCVCHDNSADSLLNLKANTDSSLVSAPAFVTDRGFTTVNGTDYMDTGYVINAAGLYQPVDCHLMVYMRTFDTVNSPTLPIFSDNANKIRAVATATPDDMDFSANSGTVTITISQNTPIGFLGCSSNGAASRFARLNDTVGSDVTSDSPGLFANNLYVGVTGAQQFSAWGLGGGMTAAQLGLYENRIRTYMQARGADVY